MISLFRHVRHTYSGTSCSAECTWNNYVPSEANISDGLTRAGAVDYLTRVQSWSLFIASCAPWNHLSSHGLAEAWGCLLCWGNAEAVDTPGLCPISNVKRPSMMLDHEPEMERRACILHYMCRHGRVFLSTCKSMDGWVGSCMLKSI